MSAAASRTEDLAGDSRCSLVPDCSHFGPASQIDRDGTHFRFILNYLRTGAVSAPPDPASKQELAIEADYYCLDVLARALRAHAMNLLDLLDEILKLILKFRPENCLC